MTRNPFQGLMPFAEEDAAYFFGREKELDVVVANLLASRLTIVYGPSGAGKSSLLHAGVVPLLRNEILSSRKRNDEAEFAVAVFSTWRGDLLCNLTECARRAVELASGASPELRDLGTTNLAGALKDLTNPLKGGLLIILDQFEEFFLCDGDEGCPDRFAEELALAIDTPHLRVNFLISLRDDALAQLDCFKGRVCGLFDNYLRIDHLDEEAARAAIVKPIGEHNRHLSANQKAITIDPSLLETVLHQIHELERNRLPVRAPSRGPWRKRPGEMLVEASYLQLVMDRLWREMTNAQSAVLDPGLLYRLGNAEHIVGNHVDEALEELTDEERAAAAKAFYFLVTPSGSKSMLTAQDIAAYANIETSELARLLWKLSRPDGARLIRAISPSPNRDGLNLFEVSHDALVPAVLAWRDKFLREVEARIYRRKLAEAEDLAIRERKEREIAEANAQEQRRLRIVSLTQALAARAPREQAVTRDERGMLLARQAFLLAQSSSPEAMDQVDSALRQVLSTPCFSPVLDGHQRDVAAVAFSQDGRTIASASYDRTIRLWNAHDRLAAPMVLPGHTDGVVCVAFNDDGHMLASGSWDRSVRLWFISGSDTDCRVLCGHSDGVVAVAFSPDSRLLASASWDGTVRVWDLQSLDSKPAILQHDDWVWSLTFCCNGQSIATGTRSGILRLWQVTNPVQPKETRIADHLGEIFTIALSPDGTILVAGFRSGLIRAWRLPETELPCFTFRGHADSVRSVAISPDGETLASGSDDQTIRLWKVHDTNAPPTILHGHSLGVSAVDFSPDGTVLVSGSWDWRVRLWYLSNPPGAPTVLRHGTLVRTVAFCRNRNLLLSGGDDSSVCVHDLGVPNSKPRILRGHMGAVTTIAISAKDEMLASGSNDSTIRLWSFDGTEVNVLQGHSGPVRSVAFGSAGDCLISGSDDRSIRVWNKLGETTGVLVGHTDTVTSVVVSPSGNVLASASLDCSIRLWNLCEPLSKPIELHGHDMGIPCLAFSANGRWLVSGSFDATLRLWDMESPGSEPAILRGHDKGIHSVAFNSTGDMIASASNDRTVRLWNVRQLKIEPIVLQSQEGGVSSVTFSPDGNRVAFGTYWGAVVIQIARTSLLADIVCRVASRNLTESEWRHFVGVDIPYERTCPALPPG